MTPQNKRGHDYIKQIWIIIKLKLINYKEEEIDHLQQGKEVTIITQMFSDNVLIYQHPNAGLG